MKIAVKKGVDIAKIIDEVNQSALKVGWSEKAKYDDGTPVAMIAAQNEFGNPAKGIPPRSFMRTSVIEKTDEWKLTTAKLFKMVFSDKQTTAGAMESLGLLVAGNIREKIAAITTPALSPRTVAARLRGNKKKGINPVTSAKPLVHTGVMLNSLTSEVVV